MDEGVEGKLYAGDVREIEVFGLEFGWGGWLAFW